MIADSRGDSGAAQGRILASAALGSALNPLNSTMISLWIFAGALALSAVFGLIVPPLPALRSRRPPT